MLEQHKGHPVLRRHAARLRSFKALRNLLSHTVGRRGEPIAEPTNAVVEEIAAIQNALYAAPKLPKSVFHSVEVFADSDPLSAALELMHRNSFSQVPVSRNGSLLGVLTSNTIARWLAENIQEDIISITETPIHAVMDLQERNDHWCVARSTIDCAATMEKFSACKRTGRTLEVLLLTDSGKRDVRIKGIVTATDLGTISRAIG